MLEVFQEHDCPYLPGLEARVRYRLIDRCDPVRYEAMLARGWRRFGHTFFRPECAACEECRSLRIDPATFEPSRSQQRTWKRNRDLQVLLRPASLGSEHLELYRRYHDDMVHRRGWDPKNARPEDYHQTFVEGRHGWGRELLFLLDGRLLAVALVDLLPSALSAVYCYYDPEERRRGLGVFSVLTQIDLARRRGIPHVYLGYWVRENQSMCYKSAYRPHDLLQGRPGLGEEPEWAAPADRSAPVASPASDPGRP